MSGADVPVAKLVGLMQRVGLNLYTAAAALSELQRQVRAGGAACKHAMSRTHACNATKALQKHACGVAFVFMPAVNSASLSADVCDQGHRLIVHV